MRSIYLLVFFIYLFIGISGGAMFAKLKNTRIIDVERFRDIKKLPQVLLEAMIYGTSKSIGVYINGYFITKHLGIRDKDFEFFNRAVASCNLADSISELSSEEVNDVSLPVKVKALLDSFDLESDSNYYEETVDFDIFSNSSEERPDMIRPCDGIIGQADAIKCDIDNVRECEYLIELDYSEALSELLDDDEANISAFFLNDSPYVLSRIQNIHDRTKELFITHEGTAHLNFGFFFNPCKYLKIRGIPYKEYLENKGVCTRDRCCTVSSLISQCLNHVSILGHG